MQRIIKRVRVIGQEFRFLKCTKLGMLQNRIVAFVLDKGTFIIDKLDLFGRYCVTANAVTFIRIVDGSDIANWLLSFHPCHSVQKSLNGPGFFLFLLIIMPPPKIAVPIYCAPRIETSLSRYFSTGFE